MIWTSSWRHSNVARPRAHENPRIIYVLITAFSTQLCRVITKKLKPKSKKEACWVIETTFFYITAKNQNDTFYFGEHYPSPVRQVFSNSQLRVCLIIIDSSDVIHPVALKWYLEARTKPKAPWATLLRDYQGLWINSSAPALSLGMSEIGGNYKICEWNMRMKVRLERCRFQVNSWPHWTIELSTMSIGVWIWLQLTAPIRYCFWILQTL